jgi:flavin-dependent dehydrogenase
MHDLIIIGGGPAGTSAAITAAQLGARVLLLERGKFPRQKVCGEFTSSESLGLLRNLLGVAHEAVLRNAVRIQGARVFLDDRVVATEVNPAAASIARFVLDLALWNSAMELGVDGRQEVMVKSIAGQGPFRVSTTAGEFEGRAVVNAAGRWSKVTAQQTDIAQPAVRWIGLKAHFLEPDAPASTDLYFFEGGYCGVQPVGGLEDGQPGSRINACAMVRADVAKTLPEVFDCHPALRQRSRKWELIFKPVSTSPLIFQRPEPVRDGMLMAGDAAGFVDPFVGDGISLALRSGAMAAKCLGGFLAERISLDAAIERYRAEYQSELAPVFRASSAMRRVLSLPRGVRRPLISLVNSSPTIARLMVSATR